MMSAKCVFQKSKFESILDIDDAKVKNVGWQKKFRCPKVNLISNKHLSEHVGSNEKHAVMHNYGLNAKEGCILKIGRAQQQDRFSSHHF